MITNLRARNKEFQLAVGATLSAQKMKDPKKKKTPICEAADVLLTALILIWLRSAGPTAIVNVNILVILLTETCLLCVALLFAHCCSSKHVCWNSTGTVKTIYGATNESIRL